MDVGFLILCPDNKESGLRITIRSILNYFGKDSEYIATVGGNVSPSDLKSLKEICSTHKAKDTITSLVNIGMKKSKCDWTFVIFSGSRVQPHTPRKLESFVKNTTDILYPIIDHKYGFVDGSFNGVLVNTEFFKEVGEFPNASFEKSEVNDFEFAKLLWALDAIKKGATFKGVIGMNIV